MKQSRERKHNFIEVENEIIYGESIVNKSRAENIIPFRHYIYNRCCLFGFGDLCQPQNLISFCAYEVLKIIKMRCNTLTIQQR